MSDTSLPRDDLRAAIEARRDLGPEYEPALVESFLDRLDRTLAARVQAEVQARLADLPEQKKESSDPWVVIASLGMGIPLTAIAASEAGVAGLLLAWGGIVAVNVAHALGRTLGRRHRR